MSVGDKAKIDEDAPGADTTPLLLLHAWSPDGMTVIIGGPGGYWERSSHSVHGYSAVREEDIVDRLNRGELASTARAPIAFDNARDMWTAVYKRTDNAHYHHVDPRGRHLMAALVRGLSNL